MAAGHQHQLQRQRFELKYLIDEATARQVRDFARCHLLRDDHAIPELRYAYPIYSLYLDGPGLQLYRATVEGQMNRFKLRIRYYNDRPASPVFFEIKRRVNEAIMKERAVVRRERLSDLLAGRCPMPGDLVNPNDFKGYSALRRFCELRSNIGATGKVIVYYLREAWVTPADDNVRLTFDRELKTARYDGTLDNKLFVPAEMGGVVLELKFDNRFPLWMQELAESCDLYRTSFPKYVKCTEALPRRLGQAISACR
jgi:hypothetical protein